MHGNGITYIERFTRQFPETTTLSISIRLSRLVVTSDKSRSAARDAQTENCKAKRLTYFIFLLSSADVFHPPLTVCESFFALNYFETDVTQRQSQ
jgi:hypothetical protein